MDEDKTEPQAADATDPDTTDDPISHVRSRVVPSGALRAREQREPRLMQARRTCAALVASASDPPLRLLAEFDLVGIGRLRTTLLGNFALSDDASVADGAFLLSFDYRGREPLVYTCASEAVYKTLSRRLFDHGLEVRGASSAVASKLVIEARVPASVRFAADRARERMSLTLRNVVMLGTTTYDLPLEAADRALIDALVGLITAQSREFYTLTARAGPGHRRG